MIKTYPMLPGFQATDTSEQAAYEMIGRDKKMRVRIVETMKRLGGDWTPDEMAAQLKATPFAVRPRMCQLSKGDLSKGHRQMIYDTGKRRLNKSGKPAIVYALIKNVD